MKHRMTVQSEAAVRKSCAKRGVMCKRSALMSEDTHKKVSASVCRFTQPDGKTFLWIDIICSGFTFFALRIAVSYSRLYSTGMHEVWFVSTCHSRQGN